MLTISSGHSADYLLDAVATGRENYYTGAVAAGEPPGRWWGAGAEVLGLSGLVDHQDMTAVYEMFIDPRDEHFRTPEKWGETSTLGHTGRRYLTEEELYAAALDAEPDASAERRVELRLEAGQRARRNVSFLDATFSVQKSVTVLHTAFEAQEVRARRAADAAASAGDENARVAAETAARSWAAHRTAVEDAIWAGNHAALSYLADHAGYSRIGHHGGTTGRFIDAHAWTVASFFQHDSRDHDPQLHIHNAILNRVEGVDGVWRTLDGRALYAHRGAAAAVGERTTEAHLARSLGVRFATRSDGKAREIVGVSESVMKLFSSRRRAITRRTRELVEAFETKYGRQPNSTELDYMQRQATFATRKAKTHDGETAEQRFERWDRQLRAEMAGGLATVAQSVLDQADRPVAEEWSPTAVLETALAAVQEKKAAWTPPELTRAISDALPDHFGDLSGDDVTRLLEGLTDAGVNLAVPLDPAGPGEDSLPDEFRLANGQSSFERRGGRRYATPEHIATEQGLVASTTTRTAPALSAQDVHGFIAGLAEQGIELGADQAAAVRGVLTSGACVESLVGPAGTGKSFVVGALAKAWQDPELWGGQQRRVVGLASSQIATNVLAGEGLLARNIARWLATQQRLAADCGGTGDDAAWRLRAGDLVVVDESAMANTPDLAAIHRHASAAGAKLLLTGDHRQLAAVGAGGGMELVAHAGAAYELVEARRFAEEWERDASLRLRDGDKTVLNTYHRHGRLLDSGTVEQAEASAARAWLADSLAGRHSLLIVDTNEQAARLSAELRAALVRLGKVDEHGVPLGLQGTYAGVGDLVQARHNGWNLAGFEGNRRGPLNREHYRVLATRDDGGLVVAAVLGCTVDADGQLREELGDRMTLPGSYVTEHVALGYASTVHAAQGLTVDTSHTVATPNTGVEALYVGMSRGRHGNTAHVTTLSVPADAATGATLEAVHRNPAAVLANTFDVAEPDRSAVATAEDARQETGSIRTPAERLVGLADEMTAGRTVRWLDELANAGHLTADQRVRIACEDGAATLNRLLRRAELAGHDPHQVLIDAVAERPLSGARQITNVLHHRITGSINLDPTGDSYAEWIPKVERPDHQAHLADLAAAADKRRAELGAQLAENPPQWAMESLGAPPAEPAARDEWQRKAGLVAAHRELTGHTDDTTALGTAPKPGQAEAYASWRSAWRALGHPEADRYELEMSDGQLRMRIRAYQRERAWEPRYVGNELAGTRQAAETQRRTAELRRAEAAAADDAETRARVEREAVEATELAGMLDQRVAELTAADDTRAEWLAHTAATRDAYNRAKAELTARHAGDPAEQDRVTAEEWLAAHDESMRAEDPHRAVTDETDIADVAEERAVDTRAAEAAPHPDAAETTIIETLETDVVDLRDVADTEPTPTNEDVVRVPTADETADTIERARRALTEISNRRVLDEQAEQAARAEQLTRWHARDEAERARETEQAAEHDAGYEAPVLDGAS